jgi:uncharacterized protein (TIGR02217 family)
MTSTFVETQFPPDISYGSKGGSGFSTTIFETTAGYEQRNINWANSRAKYDISYGIRDVSDITTVVNFFMAMQGKAFGFRFKDWADYQITNQQIGVGDGSTVSFQLGKTYTDPLSLRSYTRTIKKPVVGTIGEVTVSGAGAPGGYALDYTTGILTLSEAPASGAPVAVAYIEFDVPCRFDTDNLGISQDFWNVESWENIPITEIKL